jgi:hypothetical protein
MIKSASNYRSKRNFFEMVRFDFVIDEDLNVYIMEVRQVQIPLFLSLYILKVKLLSVWVIPCQINIAVDITTFDFSEIL